MNKIAILHAIVFASLLGAQAQSSAAVTDEEFDQLKDRFEQLVDTIDQNTNSNSATHVGGYGELHYNNLEDGNDSKSRSVDFHRFVLFFAHEFNDDIRFFSEVEIEHAFISDENDGSGNGSPGEVELEQAYIEFDIYDDMQIKGGIFLVPVGILNETHEPPTFYGVERNPIEKNIII